jgi:Fur family ferric uptake transcriptional regulator
MKATPVRLKVLEVLSTTHLALSPSELENSFSKVDRITLYRTLKDFEEAGMIHKIIDTDGVTRFAFCNNDCPDATHTEDHVHFNCKKCHKMFCLAHVQTPSLQLPDGFTSTGINTVVHGICKYCS